jgi:hypothetical protein
VYVVLPGLLAEPVIASEAKQSPFQSRIAGSAEPAAQTFEWVLEIASLRSQ